MEALYIYLVIAIVAALAVLMLAMLGLDHHIDFGHNIHIGEHEIWDFNDGPSPLSPILIMTFLASFGTIGAILEYWLKLNHVLIIGLSIAGGFPIYFAVWKGFGSFIGPTEGQMLEYGVTGLQGVVNLTILPGGTGEVIVEGPSGRISFPARAKDESSTVPAGTSVRVLHDNGSSIIVE